MANEIRRRVDFAAGGLSAGLTTGATTMTSDGLQDLPALAADEYFPLSLYRLDAMGRVTQKEVVYMTAHSAAAGSGTILRAREGTTAQAWNAGDRWSLTDLAIDNLFVCKSTTRPATPYNGMVVKEFDTGYMRQWNGTNWVHLANARMLGAGAGVAGPTPPAIDGAPAAPYYMQGGTVVIATDGAGVFTISYPVPFPNGVLTNVITACQPGAGFAHPQIYDPGGGQSLGGFGVMVYRDTGAVFAGFNSRYNWFAIGW